MLRALILVRVAVDTENAGLMNMWNTTETVILDQDRIVYPAVVKKQ